MSLVTVGFGTAQGSTIPIRDGTIASRRSGTRRDDVVVTHYHPEFCRPPLRPPPARSSPREATDKAARIKAALADCARSRARASHGEDRTPRYQWFLLPAVLLLLARHLLAGRRGRRRRGRPRPQTAVAASLLLACSSRAAAARRSAVEAIAAYRAKDYRRAGVLFAEAIRKRRPARRGRCTTTGRRSSPPTRSPRHRGARACRRSEAERRGALSCAVQHGLAHLEPRARRRQRRRRPTAPSSNSRSPFTRRRLLQRPDDLDAKWNYELALQKKKQGGGGAAAVGSRTHQVTARTSRKPQPTLAQQQAEQLLGSAEREERDVQSKKQKQNRPEPPPGGKDW